MYAFDSRIRYSETDSEGRLTLNVTVILSETELDTEVLMNAIRSTGYEVGTIQKEPYKKRGLFG